MKVDDLEMSIRTGNAMRKAGITEIDQFVALDRKTVVGLPGSGPKCWKEVQELQESLKPHVQEAQSWAKLTAILKNSNLSNEEKDAIIHAVQDLAVLYAGGSS
tara:strand:+ start:897 stop:1205 length:309 start_codon:yes stop_codon:yes gene_type:complete